MSRTRTAAIFSILLIAALFSSSAHAVDTDPAGGKAPEKGVISGTVVIKGQGPLSGGQVMLYNAASGPAPDPDKYERTPDLARPIGEDGRFSVELPAGTYYLRAVKRLSGERIGPPEAGDYIFRATDEKGMPREFRVEAGKSLDIGTGEAVPLLKTAKSSTHAVTTAIEGIIVDPTGNPVPDVIIVAFLKPAVQSKPLFVSDKTGKNGTYVLRVAPGTYYLRARNMFASGPPEPGQIVGYYGEGAPAPVTVKEGEIVKNVNFTVILFPGRGPFSGDR